MQISACWIVKNEAENIKASIMSVKDCADELIVVDTGSDDGTGAIAGECGVRVEYFQWTGDFSAARNYALSLAEGEYVIFLDGDELFTPPLAKWDRNVILGAFRESGADVLLVPRTDIAEDRGVVTDTAPYGRIMKRSVHYVHRVHEMIFLEDGTIPKGFILSGYRLAHRWRSAGADSRKLLRDIELLEAEQPELGDELSLFNNKAYLMREYLALDNYEKAFENCRFLLDHYGLWAIACKTFLFSYIQRFYAAIGLAAVLRFRFSRKEVWEKLFLGIKANYPGSREAALAGLHYQMIFDYREDRFLRELEAAEFYTANLPPCAIPESRQSEATIYGRGALAAHCRGDVEKAGRWAEIALAKVPEVNRGVMMTMLNRIFDNTDSGPGLGNLILRGEYGSAYDVISPELDRGSLDHTLLEFLLIIAEKAPAELAARARERYETGMGLLDEAIELSDMVNTGYVSPDEGKKQAHVLENMTIEVFTGYFEWDKVRPVTPDILTLHALAAPVYEEKGLPVSAMGSYSLLLAKGIEPAENLRKLTELFLREGNGLLAGRIGDILIDG